MGITGLSAEHRSLSNGWALCVLMLLTTLLRIVFVLTTVYLLQSPVTSSHVQTNFFRVRIICVACMNKS